jgi:hypothetical protein
VSNRFDVQQLPPRRGSLRVPTVLLALASLPLAAGVMGFVASASALMLGGALVVGAVAQATIEHMGATRVRERADRLLLAGRPLPPELAWRERELTGAQERAALADSLRRLVKSLEREVVLTAQVVNRPAARAQRPRLTALADRLARLESPVHVRGILLVRKLLRDGGSPLYDRTRAAQLPDHLDRALRALEPLR